MPPVVNKELCTKCGNCVDDCPGNVLSMSENGLQIVYPDECWHCGTCRLGCPTGAIDYKFPLALLI